MIVLGDTVADLLRAWLEAKRHDIKPTTLESYTRTIEQEIIPALGAVPVQSLKPATLKDFYTKKLTEKRATGCDGARCVQLCHLRLSQALDDAVNMDLIPRNVCDSVKPPRVVSKEKSVWEPEQTRTFLDVARTSGDGAVWVVLAATGMRRGEALGLRWADVAEHDNTLRVSQQVNVVEGAPYVQKTAKTDDSARRVPVDAAVIAVLKQHRAKQNEKHLQAGAAWQNNDLVFCTRDGKPLNPSNVLADFYALCDRAGLPKLNIHGLRHSYATLAIKRGDDIKAVSEVLGHRSIDITLRTYHHVGVKEHRAVAATIGAALFGAQEAI